jgi:hypothetical protein
MLVCIHLNAPFRPSRVHVKIWIRMEVERNMSVMEGEQNTRSRFIVDVNASLLLLTR